MSALWASPLARLCPGGHSRWSRFVTVADRHHPVACRALDVRSESERLALEVESARLQFEASKTRLAELEAKMAEVKAAETADATRRQQAEAEAGEDEEDSGACAPGTPARLQLGFGEHDVKCDSLAVPGAESESSRGSSGPTTGFFLKKRKTRLKKRSSSMGRLASAQRTDEIRQERDMGTAEAVDVVSPLLSSDGFGFVSAPPNDELSKEDARDAYNVGVEGDDALCMLPKPIFVVSDCTGESACNTGERRPRCRVMAANLAQLRDGDFIKGPNHRGARSQGGAGSVRGPGVHLHSRESDHLPFRGGPAQDLRDRATSSEGGRPRGLHSGKCTPARHVHLVSLVASACTRGTGPCGMHQMPAAPRRRTPRWPRR